MVPQLHIPALDPAVAAYLDEYVKAAVQEKLADQVEIFVRQNEQRAKELSLLERVIRLEEELKALREIETVHFNALHQRMESMPKLHLEQAIALYAQGLLSFGKARELAGTGKYELGQSLGRRGIPRHYTSEELKDDLACAHSA